MTTPVLKIDARSPASFDPKPNINISEMISSNSSVCSDLSSLTESVQSRPILSRSLIDMEFPRKFTELINPNTLANILKHKGVRDECKTILRAYKRMIRGGNKVTVSYDYSKDFKKERIGRVYVKDACGLQLFPRDVRAALATDYYWDIDTVCAQPTLLSYLCSKEGWACSALNQYINNRKEILDSVMEHYRVEYDDAKELFNRCLYLGGVKNWKRDLNREDEIPIHPFVDRFSKEIWTIAKNLCAKDTKLQQKINKVKNLDKEANGFDTLGAVMSYTLQSLEHTALTNLVQFLESEGRSVDTLVFDGCLVRKLTGETEFPADLLMSAAEYVAEHTGITLKFSVKPMETALEFNSETLVEESEEDCLIDDLYATRVFVKLMGDKIKRDHQDIYVFNQTIGIWEKGENAIRAEIVRHAKELYFVEKGDQPTTHNYGGLVTKQNQIISLLLSVVPDTKFIQTSIDTSKGKLLWADGIFDCETGEFSNGFDHKIVFLARIARPFPKARDTDLEKVVGDALFVLPFTNRTEPTDPEMGRFYKNSIAYAMVGDYSHKKAYVVLGDSNCGKGVITLALQSALGGYIGTFNGKDLAYNRRNGADSAKALGWIVDKLSCRMLIANEMEMDKGVALNGNLIKTLSSGGDYIDVRRNYADAQPAKITQNMFLFANDCPPITPVDSGIHTRMRYIRFTKHFVEKPLDQCDIKELPADPTIKDKVRTTEWADALFWVLYEAYENIRGKPYWSPQCVMDETKEFIGAEQQLKSKLEERYEFGEDVSEDEFIPFKDIVDYLNNECGFNGSWSNNRIGRELTELGLLSDTKKIGSRATVVRRRIRVSTD